MRKVDGQAPWFAQFDKSYFTTGTYDDYLARFKALGRLYASRIVKKLKPPPPSALGKASFGAALPRLRRGGGLSPSTETGGIGLAAGELKPLPGWRFLDVGCGMGGTILALRQQGYEAWGIEPSPYCLRYSPAKKWMKFGEVRQLPFADEAFEVVLSVDVLYYLPKKEIEKAVKELTRVAKKYVYVEVISPGSPNSRQEVNPDHLRKQESLLTSQALKKIFAKNQAFFLEPLFDPQEEIDLGPPFGPIRRVDFNGFFVKSHTYLSSPSLGQGWEE